jgi:lysophospholipase L1-like esterase
MSSTRTLVLLGDSILDNAPYTRPAPDTTHHLGQMLGGGWTVERLAQDGATIADVRFQLAELPPQADCVVLSVGGNDAAEHIDLLERRVSSAAEVLDELARIADDFTISYRELATAVVARTPRLALCTIYEPPLSDPVAARLARVPLGLLNDRIVQIASRLRVEVLDLRTVCTESTDFVKQIEPSPRGAQKIAAAIATLVQQGPESSTARIVAA